MSYSSQYLKPFLQLFKHINFWTRLFRWKGIKAMSFDALEEYVNITLRIENLDRESEELKEQLRRVKREDEIKQAKLDDFKSGTEKLENRIIRLEEELQRLRTAKDELLRHVARHEEAEENRNDRYQKNVAALNVLKESLEADRRQLHEERLREKEEMFEKMKSIWKDHEQVVASTLKAICRKYTIDYINEVPFRGKPDNTIMIAGEYIIFDAKSPASDNLDHFPAYLKSQAEQLAKYAKQENVKREMFLVIPSNTVEVLDQFTWYMGDYNVYLVTADALEPIILALRKIEDYELADKLSPEERDNICRVIGRFAHTTKRRIQIDYFFSYKFLEILGKVKSDLPAEFYDIITEFEKAEKLNPPQEKRAKQILTDELISESEKLGIEAEARLKFSESKNNDR
ncbi:MAG: hypothetical protein JXR52_06115 [Bacteroidales bacterium]|nr:hypothetical protein [Bacteroidales bacterium]MBN2698382.1 hypothetical protein [Bacteroidales bacterium]